jgi:hypothetical protein
MKYHIAKLTLLFALPVLPLSAFDIPFSTDFESDTIGSEPAGFAELKDTVFAGNSLNVAAQESVFADGPGSASVGGLGSQSLHWLDTNTTDSNPDIIVFDLNTGITQDVVIRFDFVNITGSNLRFQLLDDTGRRGIRLDLDNGGNIKNNGTGDTLESTSTNKWHALEITTNLANNTYDLFMERDDRGATKTFTDLPFNNTISNIATWEFVDLQTGSASEYYIDNLSVTVIPEPSAYALMFGALSLGVVLLRRRQG